jgi:hypothetical protein
VATKQSGGRIEVGGRNFDMAPMRELRQQLEPIPACNIPIFVEMRKPIDDGVRRPPRAGEESLQE